MFICFRFVQLGQKRHLLRSQFQIWTGYNVCSSRESCTSSINTRSQDHAEKFTIIKKYRVCHIIFRVRSNSVNHKLVKYLIMRVKQTIGTIRRLQLGIGFQICWMDNLFAYQKHKNFHTLLT